MDFFNKGESDIFKLEVDPIAKNNFLDMARWTKFLAVLGFVMMGLILFVGIFLGLFLSSFADSYGGPSAQAIANMGAAAPAIIIVVFLVIVCIYIYPTYALLMYSNCIKKAVTTDNKEQFNRAVSYLKRMFRYMGILMIVILSFYGLQIILAIIGTMRR